MTRIILISATILISLSVLSFTQESNIDTLKIDSTTVYLSWEDFADSYFSKLSPVKKVFHPYFENQMITYELYKYNIFLDFYKIESMKDFIRHYSELSMRKLWFEETQKAVQTKGTAYTQGLVPDLELPRIKTPISGIIGEGGKLSVRGSEKIDFGGQKTTFYDRTHRPNESRSILPELKMKQILNVNLQGTVGQKIHVFIDHNSEAESDLQNKIKLQYKGEEDEIIQLIEAGDTDMSLPGTMVIGAPPSYKGLFGIKALAKIGPLDITAVASKEQGESDQTTFIGQSRQDTIVRNDIDYERRRFFYLDMNFVSNDTILEFDVYIDDRNYTNDTMAVPAKVYLNADTLDTLLFYMGMFDEKLPTADYELFGNLLYLNVPLVNEYVLAVRYIKKNRVTNQIDTIGSYPPGDTFMLKLLKPENNNPSYETWNYELRNYYSFGASKIPNPDRISIIIKKYSSGEGEDSTTQNTIEYSFLLGIDENEDGYIDRQFVDNERGLIRFPSLRPFADSTILNDPNTVIYDTTSTNANLRKYYIEMTYKGAQTMIFLGQLNIIEGSEVVSVNGITLQRDIEYTIDYNTGSVEFKGRGKELMAQPNAKLTIDYQYAPFFSTASKSLIGIRGEYNLSQNNKIGTSWIYRNISTFDERPKLGQEPRSVVVGEIDGSFTTHPNFLTTLCDKLPLIETEQPSQAKINGVVALSMPDPNSMGEVYIDDMEGVKQTSDIGTSMWLWHYGSIPQGKDTSTIGKYYWYEPIRDEWIKRGDIFPNLPEDQKDDLTSYLRIVFYPKNNDPSSWLSLLNLISKTGEDLSKLRFLEFWVKGTRGTLHFDIGRSIPEDIPRWTKEGTIVGYNGTIDSEDKNKDGLLDKNEDTGLDGIQGKDSDNIPGDDGNDDYPQHAITKSDYRKLNGTENNARLDTEDLDRDGALNTNSRYIEYTISLENPDSIYVAEEHANGWRLFRIPLDDTIIGTKIGVMDWEYVKYVRLWIDGFSQRDSLQFYSIEITGTTWENMGISTLDTLSSVQPDEKLFVTQKNTEENPDYNPPFDPGKDQLGRRKREQSLVLQFQNVRPQHKGSIFMQMGKADDYTTYKTMKFYVQCNEGGPLKFYFRIGGDSTTYYQFEETISSSWKEITIPFKALTDLKLEAPEDSTHYKKGNYSFRNNPSLTNVKYLELGFINEGNSDVSGEFWIDELRLTSPRRDKGMKMNISGELRIADFLTLSGSASRTDADFQQLNMNKVAQSNVTDYHYTGTIALGKLFPKLWGFNIPLSHSKSKSVGYPKYKTGSDVILDSEQAKKERSMSGSRTEAIGFSKVSKSTNLLSHILIDPVKINASNNSSYSQTPTSMDSIKHRSITGSYSFSPGIKPLKLLNLFNFYYFPRSFGTSAGYKRNWSRRYTSQATGWKLTTHNLKRYLTISKSIKYNPIAIFTGNYSDDEIRDLDINYENDSLKKRFGEVINLKKTFSSSLSPTFGEWSRPSLTFSTSYSEDRNPNNRTMVEDSFPVRNVGNSNILSLSFDFAISKLLKMIARIRDESKDTTAITGSPQWVAIKLEQFSNYITRPNMSLSRNRNTSFGLLTKRPGWEYQFGLREGIPKDLKHPNPQSNPNNQKSTTDNLTISSGINTSIFTLNTSYTTNKNRNITASSQQISRSTTWPDINLQFPQLTKFLPKNNALKNASASINYRKYKGSNETVGKGTQSESNNVSWGPSFQMTWTRDVRTNLSANFTVNKSNNYSPIFYQTTTKTSGYNVSISYSFRAPTGLKFPLLGRRIQFSSNLDAGLDFNYSKSYSISSRQSGPTNHIINYMITPRLSYNFSENITGGLIGNYSIMNDKKQDTKSSTTGLDVWIEFKF
ncbi:MAG: hypothetical protein E3J41_00645 [Candidatus Cloacimonadota bacterium]|nr:MAG: hypothetical protein E3J41_00645 [Candidatus Cloacimonadota bacterium]